MSRPPPITHHFSKAFGKIFIQSCLLNPVNLVFNQTNKFQIKWFGFNLIGSNKILVRVFQSGFNQTDHLTPPNFDLCVQI